MRLARLLGGMLSPGGMNAKLSILIFHRVTAVPDDLFPSEMDALRFDQVLSWVGASFSVLPLDRAIAALQSGKLPPRALAITFDDGYADNFTVALPILKRHGMSATFFVASGFLDGGRMWNDTVIEAVRRCKADEIDLTCLGLGRHSTFSIADRRATVDRLISQIKYLEPEDRGMRVSEIEQLCGEKLPDDLMMSSAQLRALRASGMLIGGHTHTHPILTRLDDDAAYEEIAGGKRVLESIIGEPITLFAYPNGKPSSDYDARHVEMVRGAGFCAAVSTAPGVARANCDLWQLPRFTPWDKSSFKFALRLVHNMRNKAGVAT